VLTAESLHGILTCRCGRAAELRSSHSSTPAALSIRHARLSIMHCGDGSLDEGGGVEVATRWYKVGGAV
jgi:hypothetical protein